MPKAAQPTAAVATSRTTSPGVRWRSRGEPHRPSIFSSSGWLFAKNGAKTPQKTRTATHARPSLAPVRRKASAMARLQKERGGASGDCGARGDSVVGPPAATYESGGSAAVPAESWLLIAHPRVDDGV